MKKKLIAKYGKKRLKESVEKMKEEGFVIVLEGDYEGCLYEDKIIVALTPHLVGRLEVVFEKKALEEREDYLLQGIYREICDFFSEAYRRWQEERRK